MLSKISIKLSEWAKALFAVTILASPYFAFISLATFRFMNSGNVSIPCEVAFSAISFAGSTPKTFKLFCLKKFNKVPSLLPTSTTKEFFSGLYFLITLFAYSLKCFTKPGELPDEYV